ncbi:MAG TPA: SRPBCC family protein [Gaiellaceae bacterium]
MAGEVVFERTQELPHPVEDVFAFFATSRNLEPITPGWLRFRIVQAPDRLERGSILRYRLRLYGIPFRWRTEIVDWREPRTFVDVQTHGPFSLWVHTHRFTQIPGGTEVYDNVRYRVPGGPLAGVVRQIVAGRLDAIFDYRRARLAELLGQDGAGASVENDADGE